ncbi:MAG: LysR family transcriptional regulator [Lachnospiraceae bacterium]
MQLKEQTYVCTLARTGSISKASEELFVSQPALSVYIANLEKTMGVSLFKRIGKKFSLTYAGEKYVEKAEQMLKLKEEFDAELENILNLNSGRIRIGTQLRRAPYIVPTLLSRFQEEYPEVEVIVKSGIHSELEEMWRKQELDLILCMEHDRWDEMDYYMVKDERVLLALPQGHPLNARAEQRPGHPFHWMDVKLLEQETFILPISNQSLRSTVDRMLRRMEIHPGRIIEVSNIEVIIQMVAEGMGIGFNREGYIQNMSYPKQVCYYEIGDPALTSRLVLATRKGLERTSYMERFLEIFEEEISKSI